MPKKIMGITKVSFTIFIGWLVSRTLFTYIRDINIGVFKLLPGFIAAYILIFFIAYRLINGRGYNYIILFLIGIISDSLVYWTLRTGTQFVINNGWDIRTLSGSGITLIIVLLLAILFKKTGSLIIKGTKPISVQLRVSTILVFILIIVAYRVTYLLTQHLPNESRSFFLYNYEIHHANWGVIALIIIGLMLSSTRIGNDRGIFLISGAGAAFFIDQFAYMQLIEVTDQAYGGLLSLSGAVIAGLLYISFIVFKKAQL